MAKNKHESLVERHAHQRLHQVTKARRKPYTNRQPEDKEFNWMGLIMQVILIIVLISMLLSIT